MHASRHTHQAHNPFPFQKKKKTHNPQLPLQGTNNFIAGTASDFANRYLHHDQLQLGSPPNYLVSIPELLPGPRCFSYASLRPDQTTTTIERLEF